jgi:cell division protein FtsZ
MSSTDFDNIAFDLPKNQSNVIKVIGVGGGGSNAVNYMYAQGIKGVDFVICNTDSQALQNSPIPTKIRLGVSLTEGLGAGANPEIGEQAAMENIHEIKEMLSTNSKMVFITVGMGGGTGTGAAPVIAQVAREMDLLTIGIVTVPFSFEGKMRNDQAQMGLERLRESVDSLVVINNNKLRDVYGNLGFKSGFSKADEVLSTAARGIAEVITHHYTQNIDLRDAKTVLANSGTAIMGSATGTGVNRSEIAISKALDSPLLNDNKITGAKNVLLLIISGSEEITIDEIGEINDYIQAEAKSNVNIIMGVGEDQSLGEAISVTIVATGFHKDQQHDISNVEAKKIIHTLDDNQEATYDFSEKKVVASTTGETPDSDSAPSEEKIVYKLEEEEEVEIEMIPNKEFINNLEVIYEEILPDSFVIREVETKQEEVVSIEEEENQISFTFDMPISKAKKEVDIEEIRKDIHKIEVIDHQVIQSPRKMEEEVYFSLEEMTELEDKLSNAKKPEETVENEEEDAMNLTLKTDPSIDINEQEVVDFKEVSPLDLTISELQERASERKKKMKEFNYKFINKMNKNIDEIEKEPAYKRMGVELDETSHSSDITQSRTTLEVDDENDIQLRSNNSFLHDNVD